MPDPRTEMVDRPAFPTVSNQLRPGGTVTRRRAGRPTALETSAAGPAALRSTAYRTGPKWSVWRMPPRRHTSTAPSISLCGSRMFPGQSCCMRTCSAIRLTPCTRQPYVSDARATNVKTRTSSFRSRSDGMWNCRPRRWYKRSARQFLPHCSSASASWSARRLKKRCKPCGGTKSCCENARHHEKRSCHQDAASECRGRR